MQPDPVIEANEICSLGARDPIVGAVTEPKQSHSAAVIHENGLTSVTATLHPVRFLPLLCSSYGGFDTGDENLCFYIVKPKRM